MTVNVYEQYFEADMIYEDVPRRGALVMLIAESGQGMIRYEAAVSFFPHREPDDFAVSYDAYFSKELYSGRGRRSKKREQAMLGTLRDEIDSLAQEQGGTVFWEQPLQKARLG